MPLTTIEQYPPATERQVRVAADSDRSNGVLSPGRGGVTPNGPLEFALDSALRSKDSELDQLLSALQEISKGLNSGSLSVRNLDEAVQRAASCALRQALID